VALPLMSPETINRLSSKTTTWSFQVLCIICMVIYEANYLHGYIRSDQVGIRLLPIDETFELQFTEANFSASAGVLRVSGPCFDMLINTSRNGNEYELSNSRNTRPLGCQSTFVNETLSDTLQTVVSVMQSDVVTIESTGNYLLLGPQGGELLAFNTVPLRADSLELNPAVNLSQRRWALESIRTLESGFAAVPLGMTAFMSFGQDQMLELDLGCSSGSGGVRVGSGIISIIDLILFVYPMTQPKKIQHKVIRLSLSRRSSRGAMSSRWLFPR